MNAPTAHAGLIRASLWLSAPFNLFAAGVLAFPGSLPGQLLGLPPTVPVLYAALTGLLVALFGLVYAWLAMQTQVHPPLLAFAALGKASVFLVALLLWLSQAVAPSLLLLASGDLAFAALWLWWLLTTADSR